LVDTNSSINIRICSRTYQLIYIYICGPDRQWKYCQKNETEIEI